MGYHYIQEGMIKIYKDILDIVCPASGYSETPPPTEIYCPAQGYYDPNDPLKYIPDPNLPPTPEPGTGEIILICTTALDAAVALSTTTSVGQANYSVYGDNDTLINSTNVNSGATHFYEFPSSGGIQLTSGLEAFKIIITPVTGNITVFKTMTKTSWAPLGWPILECHVKCPDLTQFANAFLNQRYIQLIEFYGAHDSLTNLSSFAENTENLKKAILPTSLNGLVSMSSAFRSSGVEEVVIQANSLPVLGTLYRAFLASGIKKNPLSNISVLPALTTFDQAFSSTKNLKIDLVLPEAPICASVSSIANQSAVTKLIFQGTMNEALTSSNVQGIVWNANNCTEVVMPSEMTNLYDFTYTWRDAGALKKVTLPNAIVLTISQQSSGQWFAALSSSVKSDNVEEITTCASWTVPADYFLALNIPRKLKQFNQPTLKPARLNFQGTSTVPSSVTYLNIDFSGLNPAYTVALRYNQFDATELERISGQLPTVASGNFDVRNNPGYATFDKTIAEGKGWTVL